VASPQGSAHETVLVDKLFLDGSFLYFCYGFVMHHEWLILIVYVPMQITSVV
jgi:hypothetical protein